MNILMRSINSSYFFSRGIIIKKRGGGVKLKTQGDRMYNLWLKLDFYSHCLFWVQTANKQWKIKQWLLIFTLPEISPNCLFRQLSSEQWAVGKPASFIVCLSVFNNKQKYPFSDNLYTMDFLPHTFFNPKSSKKRHHSLVFYSYKIKSISNQYKMIIIKN